MWATLMKRADGRRLGYVIWERGDLPFQDPDGWDGTRSRVAYTLSPRREPPESVAAFAARVARRDRKAGRDYRKWAAQYA